MKIGEPDWALIAADTRRGVARFWPLLLGFALFDTGIGVAVDRLAGGADALEPGLTGYVAYLKACLLGLVPYAAISALSAAMVLNGMAGRPVPRAAITRRAVQALPAVIVSTAIFMAPWVLSGLITYANVDSGTWWLARTGSAIAIGALMSVLGFIDFEAIAKGLGPAAAIRASAALTRGARTWLAWLYVGLGLFDQVLMVAASPLDDRLREGGLTWLGSSPASDGLLRLVWLVVLPFGVAVYLELRRLQAGEAAGLATFD